MSAHPIPHALPAPASTLTPAQLQADLALTDLTDPRHGHALHQILDDVVAALTERWRATPLIWRTGPVVSVEDNYDRLGYPPDAAARDARYTRYVSDTCMLRAHTSAMIPPLLRHLAREWPPSDERATEDEPDLLCVCPGLVYRRDAIDRIHTGTPHQADLWLLSTRPQAEADLEEMVRAVVGAALPGARHRSIDAEHPYTRRGRQVDALVDGEWVEVLECGLAEPAVLARAGLDPSRVHGLAMGVGLDRLVMLRKHLPDIRLLRSADPRIVGQFHDLEPYRPVSDQPAIRRDLSLAMADHLVDEELLGDLVRTALGSDIDSVEEVSIRAVTPLDLLTASARERLGIRDGQVNVLVRVVLRRVDRTLTSEEANQLRDRIYGALHQGDRHQWAAG